MMENERKQELEQEKSDQENIRKVQNQNLLKQLKKMQLHVDSLTKVKIF